MFESARRARCEAGRLVKVRYGVHPEDPDDLDVPSMVWVVRLSFEFGDWSLVAVPDDDTVLITSRRVTDDVVFADAPENSPWQSGIGRYARWIWAMTNQQGYLDGIQFELTDPGRGMCQIQMIVIASEWQIRELADP